MEKEDIASNGEMALAFVVIVLSLTGVATFIYFFTWKFFWFLFGGLAGYSLREVIGRNWGSDGREKVEKNREYEPMSWK